MTTGATQVLLIDDDLSAANVYMAYLAKEPYDVRHEATGRAGLEAIAEALPDVLLLDLKLPDMDGFDILRELTSRQVPVETVVITGHGSMNIAIEAMKLGARDFVVKPFAKERLLCTLKNVLEHQSLTRIVETYRENVDRHGYCGFIGSSLAMQGVYRIIDSAAQSKASVFITGESGTGKEVCAEAIHQKSDRTAKPFIAINCAAIPRDLLESEIFGHVKGAFTGAVRDREGAASQANGGTLFLDEICELEPNLQPKLLRFLQTGTFQPVGSDRTETVDVRIICATNRNPLDEVAAGRFREDLYYRLHVLPVNLPPLRERDGDIIEIALHFLTTYSKEEGKAFERYSTEVEEVLAAFSWPGNIRQMQNVIRNVVVLNDGDMVTPDMLPVPLGDTAMASRPTPSTPETPPPPPAAAPSDVVVAHAGEPGEASIRPIAELEREAVERAIAICEGNVPRAAHFLGVSAATIYRKKAAWQNG